MNLIKKIACFAMIVASSQSLATEKKADITLTNAKLQAVYTTGAEIVDAEVLGTCGFKKAVRIDLQQKTDLHALIVSLLTGEYTNAVIVNDLQPTAKAIKSVVRSMEKYPMSDRDAARKAIKDLTALIVEAGSSDDNLLFSAEISGEFDTDITAVVIIDKANSELVAVGEGYCE